MPPDSSHDAPLAALPCGPAIEALLQRGGDLLVVTDTQGRLTWANPRFFEATGLAPSQALGCELPHLACANADALDAAFASGQGGADIEFALQAPGADTLWCRARVTPFDGGFVCVLHDHRELRRMALEARRLAELLDMAQEFGRLGVWERDIPSGDGRWGRHVFRFFDMDPTSGTPNFELASQRIHPEDRLRSKYLASTASPGYYDARYRVIARDGTTRVLHSHWRVLAGADGRPERAIGIMVDDTEVYELAHSLGEARTRLELALDLGGIAVWRHDLKTNLMHYDAQALRILGMGPRADGIPLDEVRSWIHPDDLPAVRRSAERSLAGLGPTDVEARYRHADGSWRYILTRRSLQRDAHGAPIAFIGVGLDVTERVEESRRTLELARRLEATARSAGIGLWSMNLDTGVSEWNGKMFELFGLPPEGQPPSFDALLQRRVHPEDRARLRRSGGGAMQGRSAAETEYRVRLDDGSVRWLLNRSDLDPGSDGRRLFGVTIDVTDRKRTEAALRQSNEQIALTARATGIATWEHDLVTDTVHWDAQMFALRGLEPRAQPPDEAERAAITHPADIERMRQARAASVSTGQPGSWEFRVRHPDGSLHWIAGRCLPMRDDNGRVTRLIGLNWDVTDARLADLERQERIAAQRESRAKSQFLARMSHELRTPLNAVLGFTQLMLADDAPTRDAAADRARLTHVHAAGEHLLSLINDVLDLSSLETGDLRMSIVPVALGPLVRDTLPLVERLAQSHQVNVRCGVLEGTAWADPTRLRQVLLNLLSNAIKYNRPGGEVQVEAHHDGSRLRLHVRDTGRGLTPEQMHHLFEPFNRLGVDGESIEGTGIGLAIVKAIVAHMGASVDVRSTPGSGSEFIVRLEDARQAPPAAAPAQRATPSPPPKAYEGQVLYIEDNAVNVLIVEQLVARCSGLSLESEPDGTRGVARAAELQPDLVLVDMQLPDIDGHEVLRRLRADAATARIPCIALSANAMPEDIERALAAGFADYWTKPIDIKAFMASLDALFGAT